MLAALATVTNWVRSQSYSLPAINTFFAAADFHLVAHALAHKHTVVTHEKAAPSIHTVKIPSVCIGVGVKCVTPFEMLTHERPRFVLGT